MNEYIRPTTLHKILKESVTKFANKVAFEVINGDSLTFKAIGERVEKLNEIFKNNNIKRGEKIAILGGSIPNWPVSYLSITSNARVVVPLLPDFTAFEIANILEHSGTKAIIISKKLIYKLSDSIRNKLNLIICMDDLVELKIASDNLDETELEEGDNEDSIGEIEPPKEDEIASIIYTSGTSGSSKGVMLTHANLTSNIEQAYHLYPITEKDVFLSFLPLSHAYECTLGMLYPFHNGATVYYLNGAPTPSLLLPALKKVRPTCICSVPLIVEKIFKNKVRPLFTKNWIMQILYSINPIRHTLHKIAGKKLTEMFGGNLKFFGIGGSKLDSMVEKFLRDAKFPYAIGYGLTECSPLIAGQVNKVVFQSTGPRLYGVEMKIHNPNENGVGEIVVKGPNIMKGYYKDEAKTKEAFLEDGWFRTKDLGVFDKKGNLFIKGRADNMLIGANGENIYPEEIESILNDNDFVLESLVVKDGDRLIAKVYYNYEQIANLIDFKVIDAEIRNSLGETYDILTEKYEKLSDRYEQWKKERGMSVSDKKKNKVNKPKTVRKEIVITFQDKFDKVQKELLQYVNERVNKTSKISEIIEQPVPFEKTATQKIKRYLYK